MSKIKQFLQIKSSLGLSVYLLGIIICLGIGLLNSQGLTNIEPLWGRLGFLPYLVIDLEDNQESNWIYNVLPILMIDQIFYQQWMGVLLFLSLWIVFWLLKKSNNKKETVVLENSPDNRSKDKS